LADPEFIPPGWLLAAWPDLLDPNFMHSVILVCRHTEDGAFGLVLNDPLETDTTDLLADHPVFGRTALPVFRGGPVDTDTLQFVHRLPHELPGAQEISDELWMGGDFEALGRFVERHPERALGELRFFVGYSGWGVGQLEEELAGGSWVPAPPDTDEVFAPEPAGAWKRVLRGLGDVGRGLAEMPPDPEWN
jgi:putative transcriptional regulator